MIRRIIQHRQSKCNFCFQWFIVKSEIKNCLHVCDSCLQKALNTSCFKVPSASGEFLYQVYLIGNHLPLQSNEPDDLDFKSPLIEEMQNVRNVELQQFLEKWRKFQENITNCDILNEEKYQHYQKMLSQAQKQVKKFHDEQYKKITEPKNQESIKANNTRAQPQIKENESKLSKAFSPLIKTLSQASLKASKNKTQLMSSKKRMKDQSFMKNDLLYLNQSKQNISLNSNLCPPRFNEKTMVKKESQKSLKKADITQLNLKIAKDLEVIRKDALKSKIYSYLETESSVPQALFFVMTHRIYDAIRNTNTLNKCIQLVLFDISDIDIGCYLEMLEWKDVEVLKLVKVGLTDEQVGFLIRFLQEKKVETLVATSNKLTENACKELLGSEIPSLKNVYLGRNKIFKFKIRDEMRALEQKYYIYF